MSKMPQQENVAVVTAAPGVTHMRGKFESLKLKEVVFYCQVLEVNGHSCVDIDHYEAVGILKAAGSYITLRVIREIDPDAMSSLPATMTPTSAAAAAVTTPPPSAATTTPNGVVRNSVTTPDTTSLSSLSHAGSSYSQQKSPPPPAANNTSVHLEHQDLRPRRGKTLWWTENQ